MFHCLFRSMLRFLFPFCIGRTAGLVALCGFPLIPLPSHPLTLSPHPSRAPQAAPLHPSLQQADLKYRQKSYALALKGYEQALKNGSVPAERRDEVAYRIAVSLGKTEQWDRALEQSLAFVQQHRNTVWEARGLYWLGRLYLGAPHQGWRVGKKVSRGENVPKTASAERPEPVYLQEQDRLNARDALEAARVLYTAHPSLPRTEEIQLNFDLARVLEQDPRLGIWGQ